MESNFNQSIQNKFIIILAIVFSIGFYFMIKPYIITLILAAITAGLSQGLYKKLLKLFRKKGISSAFTVGIVLLLFIVPLLVFAGIVIDQAIQVANDAVPFVNEQIKEVRNQDGSFSVPDWVPERIKEALIPYQEQILERLAALSGTAGKFVVNQITSITKGSVMFFLQLFIFLYGLFFFIMDGKNYILGVRKYVPIDDEDFDEMLDRGLSITRATLKGAIFIGVLQGALIGAAFAVLGIKGAAFWGAISIILSLIPSVGSGIVWLPAVIYLFSTGQTASAIGLLIWGGAIVGSIDNVLRPKLVGQDTKMSDLVILLSTLGGIGIFGIVGFILGPILAGMVITVWKIYGDHLIDNNQLADDTMSELADEEISELINEDISG